MMKLNLKSKKSLDRVLLIDADVFVYQAIMDNLREVCQDDVYHYSLLADDAQNAIEQRMETMTRELRAKDVFLAFGSMNNWRKKLLPEYKAHRTQKKPLGYWDTIAWCLKTWPGMQVPFLEADDIVGVLATKPNGWPDDLERVIVSEDKDLDTVHGKHYNPRKPEIGVYDVSVETAHYNHMMQTLCGDSADGYKGCPGSGPVKAAKILGEHKFDLWAGVVAAFKEAKLTEADALVQARVAHILTAKYCDLKTGKVAYWAPPGRSVAGSDGPKSKPVRRVARVARRSA